MQTVLIAEDWTRLRRRLDEALREAGYFTILAQTGQEALGVLRWVPVDLLLARERLADVEGSALARILRRRGHEELVILLQGEDGEAARRALDAGVVDAVVPRTLEVAAVVELVREHLRPVVVHSPPSADFGDSCAPVVA